MKHKLLTGEEFKVINLFRDNLLQTYTIREIMDKLRKNSYNWVFNTIKKLENMEIVTIESKGGSHLCSFNMNHPLALSYLSLSEKLKITDKLPLKNIRELIGNSPFSYFSFFVTGSYARGDYTKKSDLDIVVIVEAGDDTKKMFSVLKNKGDLMLPRVHLYVFSKNEFLKMLLDKEENYGKEIFRNHIILFGAENYYLILREAVFHGF